jgi:general secretion pathway protein C
MIPIPRRYHIIFNLFVLSIIIYIGVDIFYTAVRAKLRQVDTKTSVAQAVTDYTRQPKPPFEHYRSILGRNIFGSTDKPSDEVEAEDIEALEPTKLAISLLGTVTGSPHNTYAVIEETNRRKQGLFKVGDTVQDAVVKMILRGKVVLSVQNRDEILTMDESAKPPTEKEKEPVASRSAPRPSTGTASRTITVQRSDVEESLTDINKLLSEVRVRPHFKDGQPDGLAISRIKAGSFFAKLGLRNGDVVQKIDGSSIKTPDDILTLYEKLKSGSQVGVEIDRRGRQETISYRFR